MAKRVFFIEREKFLREMAELLFKNRGFEIYTTDKINDNFYLLDDLHPDIVVFDLKTVLSDQPILMSDELNILLSYDKKCSLIAVLQSDEKENVLADLSTLSSWSHVRKVLFKPLAALDLVDQVTQSN